MLKVDVYQAIEKFVEWQEGNGFFSYDQYDFWSAPYGILSKSIYYRNKALGIPLVAPVFAADLLFPASRKIFSHKKRFPIADAHFILAYLNLYSYTSCTQHLDKAKEIAEDLLKSSVDGYSGYCWGYPFDWMTTRGLWKGGVPLITSTGYCFEAFLALFKVTKEPGYLDIAHSIFHFALTDLKDTVVGDGVSSSSYSPIDASQIINANAYRAFVLVEGYALFKTEAAIEKATANIKFILTNQQDDGSWLYSVNDKRDHFVDNFHTCFVLKNLIKINRILKSERIGLAIKKGFHFYKWHLLDKNRAPLPFAKLSRINIVRRELYDYAEGLSLCLDMQAMDLEAGDVACKQVTEVVTKYQKKDGSFITRTNIFHLQNRVPYLRWPQAQLFFALTNYLHKYKG